MRAQLTALQQAHATTLAARDRQLADLKASTEKLHATVSALSRPKAPVRKAKKPAAKKSKHRRSR